MQSNVVINRCQLMDDIIIQSATGCPDELIDNHLLDEIKISQDKYRFRQVV